MFTVNILFFAGAAEATGIKRLSQQLPDGTTLGQLVAGLGEEYPGLRPLLASALWAVNEEYAQADRVLQANDEVAMIPPVSGGSEGEEAPVTVADEVCCRILAGPLSVDEALGRVMHPHAGGVVVFLGTVRGLTGEQRTVALEYEAYGPMAEKVMARVAGEVRERWPDVRLALLHRVGHLEVGEISVVVAASAPHRPQAFAAARRAIDRLKEIVPIWKREIGEAGEAAWVQCAHDHDEEGA